MTEDIHDWRKHDRSPWRVCANCGAELNDVKGPAPSPHEKVWSLGPIGPLTCSEYAANEVHES